jgi:hypothetical protein
MTLGLDDLISRESAVVAAATAAVFSPRTRETLRKGAVLGVAGALKVGDVVAGAARGATRGVRGDESAPTPAAAKDNSGSTSTRNRRSPSSGARRARGTSTSASAQ